MSEVTQSFVQTTVEIGVCPLCDDALTATLNTEVKIPTDKLNDTNVIRASVKMEPWSLTVDHHHCSRVEPVRFAPTPRGYARYGPNRAQRAAIIGQDGLTIQN